MAENQFVIFKLGEERYAVDILNVGGISEFRDVTKVPNAPYFIDGIINLRGDIIPIVSLKKRFNIPEKAVDSDTRIIINNIRGKDIGFVVDEASQVIKIDDADIEDAPDIVKGADRQYISGVGKVNDQIVILLNLEKILSEEEQKPSTPSPDPAAAGFFLGARKAENLE